jgi:hypothetical protein
MNTGQHRLRNPLVLFLAPILLLAMGAFPDIGCTDGGPSVRGSGTVITENRSVAEFHGVEVRNQGNLVIAFGPEESLVVEAEDNLLEHLASEVRDGILYFDTIPSGTNIRTRKPIVYRLTAVSLDSLSTSSAGSITAPAMEVDSLVVDISSAGSVEIESLIAHALRANLSSAGNLRIQAGAVIDQIVSVSSAGKYDAENMSSERATLNLSSAGKATVLVNEYLEADISSVGNLYYSGEAEVDVNTSSMGKAIRLDD